MVPNECQSKPFLIASSFQCTVFFLINYTIKADPLQPFIFAAMVDLTQLLEAAARAGKFVLGNIGLIGTSSNSEP